MSLRNLIWRGMIKLRPIADDDPVLDQSRRLQAMELAFAYADTRGEIGLTQTKALDRKFGRCHPTGAQPSLSKTMK